LGSFVPAIFLYRYGVGVCLALVGLAAALMAMCDAGVPVPQALFAVVWALLWIIAVVTWLSTSWHAARYGAHALWPLALVGLMVLYVSVRLVGSSFAVDDELTSWNYWAEQHFLGMPADFTFTKAAYPQLFAAWIASIYRAVGTFEWQWVARASLVLVTLWLGLLLVRAADRKGRRGAWVAAVLLLLLWLDGFRISFGRGLADPLMVVALLTSVHYFLEYARDPRRTAALMFCVSSAIVASYTKQPALLWGCLGLPILTGWQVVRGAWQRWTLIPVAISSLISAAWPLLFGRGFAHNQGVITRSLAQRGVMEQLGHSALTYLVDRPAVLLLMIASLALCWSKPVLRSIWLILLLPSMLAWFIWGAYSLRLGLHVLGLAALLLLHALEDVPVAETASAARARHGCRAALLMTVFAMVGAAGTTMWWVARQGIDIWHGPEITLRRYFGDDEESVRAIYRSKVPIWVSSNYLNGMFYGGTPVTAPRVTNEGYGRNDLFHDLAEAQAQYAFTAGAVPYGSSSLVLEQAASACPQLFHEITRHSNELGFHVYRVDLASLRSGLCRG